MSANDPSTGFSPELTENLQRVLVAMHQCGIAGVELAYHGMEDSGGCIAVYAFDAAGKHIKLSDNARIEMFAALGYNDPITIDCTLKEAFDIVVDAILQAYEFSGYENNDGGQGSIVLMATGELRVNHSYRIYQYDDEPERTARITLPTPQLPPFDANVLVAQIPATEPALAL